jgi:SPX domain protein involved in polyphosphate accumulation
MTHLETKFQRLERKYLIDEVTAARVRRDLAAYCDADEHNPASTGRYEHSGQLGYPIRTLYLDSPELAFYNANMRGDAVRLKLRIRTYSDSSPALLEIKRRVSEVIDKTRVMVEREDVARAVEGREVAVVDDPGARRCLSEFGRLAASAGAEPTLQLRYEREAYASFVDHYARVCFDRRIGAQRTYDWNLLPDPGRYCEFDHFWGSGRHDPRVVLELKCESAMPHWMTDLVRRHGLSRTSFAKYAVGVHLTGRLAGRRARPVRDARVMA